MDDILKGMLGWGAAGSVVAGVLYAVAEMLPPFELPEWFKAAFAVCAIGLALGIAAFGIAHAGHPWGFNIELNEAALESIAENPEDKRGGPN